MLFKPVIYKGTFDPFHGGHMMNTLLARSYTRQPVIVIPNALHQFKQMTPLHHRTAMLERLFLNTPNILIGQVSNTRALKPSDKKQRYFDSILEVTTRLFPQAPKPSGFFKLAGADAFINDVNRGAESTTDSRFTHIITSRGSKREDEKVLRMANEHGIPVQMLPFTRGLRHGSSSELQQAIHSKQRLNLLSDVPQPVKQYIYQHRLYGTQAFYQEDIYILQGKGKPHKERYTNV